MFSNQRKTIGVLVEAVLNEFPKRLCQGVIQAAEKSGYNVAIFTSYGSYGNNVEYFKGDWEKTASGYDPESADQGTGTPIYPGTLSLPHCQYS